MRSSPPSIQSGDSELWVSAHDARDDLPSQRAVYTNQLFKGSPTAREREGETASCSVHADCMFTLPSAHIHVITTHTHLSELFLEYKHGFRWELKFILEEVILDI